MNTPRISLKAVTQDFNKWLETVKKMSPIDDGYTQGIHKYKQIAQKLSKSILLPKAKIGLTGESLFPSLLSIFLL